MTEKKSTTRWESLAVVLSAAAVFSISAPAARASNIDLYDLAISTSTGVSGDWQDVSTTDPTTLIDGTSTMVCCGDASGGTTPGLGILNYTFAAAPGSYTVTMYFDYDAATPYFNEYGSVNDPAAIQSGITYEVFNATAGTTGTNNISLFGESGVPGGEAYGLANGNNNVPGTTDNFLAGCTAANCNADVGMALTFSFTLAAGQYAVLTADASTTNPGGFSLQTTHPVDANNSAASSVYLTGSYAIDSGIVTTGTPEPSTWLLMGSVFALFVVGRGVRRQARV